MALFKLAAPSYLSCINVWIYNQSDNNNNNKSKVPIG